MIRALLIAVLLLFLAGCSGMGCYERTPAGRGITACGGLS